MVLPYPPLYWRPRILDSDLLQNAQCIQAARWMSILQTCDYNLTSVAPTVLRDISDPNVSAMQVLHHLHRALLIDPCNFQSICMKAGCTDWSSDQFADNLTKDPNLLTAGLTASLCMTIVDPADFLNAFNLTGPTSHGWDNVYQKCQPSLAPWASATPSVTVVGTGLPSGVNMAEQTPSPNQGCLATLQNCVVSSLYVIPQHHANSS